MISGRLSSTTMLILLLLAAGLSACGEEESHSDHHHHDDEHLRLTLWENGLELFATFEVHENSGRIEGTLYLSDNHQPLQVEEGEIRFVQNGSVTDEQSLSEKERGVYPFELHFNDSDEAELAVTFRLDGSETGYTLGLVNRYDTGEDGVDEPELAELSKEMQWRMSVEAGYAAARSIPDVVYGTGMIQQDPDHSYEIYSPVDGVIDAGNIHVRTAAGSEISEGQRLVTISPSLSSENSWTELKMAYAQAEQAYERAQRLIQSDAISLREYQEREREYEVRKAGYEQFLNGNGAKAEDGGSHLHLNAASSGVIAESNLTSGRDVKQGDLLFTLFNPDHLWIEVLAYQNELAELEEVTGLEILVSGDSRVTLSGSDLSFVSRDRRSDASGSRIRSTYAINNSGGALSVNQPVRVRLAGDASEELVSVPNEAIFDHEAYKVVFVMHSGDQFERRTVQTGSSYGGYTAITDGLEEGERVVTSGVYPLHLMTGNVQIDDDHDH